MNAKRGLFAEHDLTVAVAAGPVFGAVAVEDAQRAGLLTPGLRVDPERVFGLQAKDADAVLHKPVEVGFPDLMRYYLDIGPIRGRSEIVRVLSVSRVLLLGLEHLLKVASRQLRIRLLKL
jgi:hypothetical protein